MLISALLRNGVCTIITNSSVQTGELFWAPNEDTHPPFNTHPEKLRALAKEKLSEGGWSYASSNAGLSWTHWHAIPRHCNTNFWTSRIEAVAKANDALVSSGSTTDSPNGAGNGVRFYQLYWSPDGNVTLRMLKRTSDNGDLGLADARKAVKIGVDGIVVSNHAGRQVDGAIGSLDALEKIVEAAGDKTYMSHFHRLVPVMFDSGIRGGADVFKALALGAKFVWIVRLWVYALGSGGEEGVRHIVKGLLADFDILMNVSAYLDFSEINKNTLDSMPRGACFL
ncbi:hypothetical protein NPX13_g2632 [Xylaria arbuscula]|uniref:FMN hydroxy acid dehydrogenase domain-containing protein n=1 Tax=Xylaria arbuscula TaxID=114810 RepID=A0A9W8NJE3_9PEZI|nr:hypothetical protein NPX13_g2632 [Xylaria arbuscula]